MTQILAHAEVLLCLKVKAETITMWILFFKANWTPRSFIASNRDTALPHQQQNTCTLARVIRNIK